MKRYYYFFLTICILLTECQSRASNDVKNDYYTIDFEQCIEKEKPMLLSEIADSIEYIELKTPEDIIISDITNIIPLNEDLFICAREGDWMQRGVYQFRRDGQYVKRIGSTGWNIGEYVMANDFQIDIEKEEVIIMDPVKICYYDFNGKHLRSTIPQTSYMKTSIGISNSILWINIAPRMFRTKVEHIATAITYNENYDSVATLLNPFFETITPDSSNLDYIHRLPAFYHKNGLLYYKPNHSYDTLWQISGKNKEIYAFINMGKYKLPLEYERWYSSVEFEKFSHNYWAIKIIAEDDRYIFFLAESRNPNKLRKNNYIVYDKKKKRGFTAKNKKDIKITDDIMFGPSVWPLWISEKYYMTTITRDELQKKIEDGNYSPSEPLNSQFSRIGENDNDIIILCHKKIDM